MTIYDPATEKFKPGPNMTHNFYYGACLLMTSPKHQHRNVIIAAGGYKSNKVQLLDYTQSQEWEESKYTPLNAFEVTLYTYSYVLNKRPVFNNRPGMTFIKN